MRRLQDHSSLRRWLSTAVAVSLSLFSSGALAETLTEALTHTYQTNRTLNAERAKVRAADEGVPQALAGYRPQIAVGLSGGLQAVRDLLPGIGNVSTTLRPWTAGVTINQTIYNGLRTGNSVRQAEAQVRAAREALRGVEQDVLLDAVNAYMNVARDQTLVEVQRANLGLLREMNAVTRRRYDAGDVTPTDVAQTEARMSRGAADLNAAEIALAVSQAAYYQVIGLAPGRVLPVDPLDGLLPHARDEAIEVGYREHPAVLVASYNVDAAEFAVKVAEGALLPTLSAQGSVSRSVQTDTTLGTSRTDQASIMGQASIPIYDGGMAASQVRQAKEVQGQRRIEFDIARSRVATAVVAAWVAFSGARVAINAAQAEVRAAATALAGVQKEAQGGQRTTIDVLNSLQEHASARARLVQAQRDRVVASYTLLSAIGGLDHRRLGLPTPDYDALAHYHQVRDVWQGVRTPDGK
jgi:outer membrane protein